MTDDARCYCYESLQGGSSSMAKGGGDAVTKKNLAAVGEKSVRIVVVVARGILPDAAEA